MESNSEETVSSQLHIVCGSEFLNAVIPQGQVVFSWNMATMLGPSIEVLIVQFTAVR
jgi:hypothetical protein